eukprot:1156376-Pelagomonas_calceolata.AAC.2
MVVRSASKCGIAGYLKSSDQPQGVEKPTEIPSLVVVATQGSGIMVVGATIVQVVLAQVACKGVKLDGC